MIFPTKFNEILLIQDLGKSTGKPLQPTFTNFDKPPKPWQKPKDSNHKPFYIFKR